MAAKQTLNITEGSHAFLRVHIMENIIFLALYLKRKQDSDVLCKHKFCSKTHVGKKAFQATNCSNGRQKPYVACRDIMFCPNSNAVLHASFTDEAITGCTHCTAIKTSSKMNDTTFH